MPLFLFVLVAIWLVPSPAPACELTGRFRIDGGWSSFDHWWVVFDRDRLLSSWTDDLPSEQWRVLTDLKPGVAGPLVLANLQTGSDTYFGYLVHAVKGCRVGRGGRQEATLAGEAAYETVVAFDGPMGPESVQRVANLAIYRENGRE